MSAQAVTTQSSQVISTAPALSSGSPLLNASTPLPVSPGAEASAAASAASLPAMVSSAAAVASGESASISAQISSPSLQLSADSATSHGSDNSKRDTITQSKQPSASLSERLYSLYQLAKTSVVALAAPAPRTNAASSARSSLSLDEVSSIDAAELTPCQPLLPQDEYPNGFTLCPGTANDWTKKKNNYPSDKNERWERIKNGFRQEIRELRDSMGNFHEREIAYLLYPLDRSKLPNISASIRGFSLSIAPKLPFPSQEEHPSNANISPGNATDWTVKRTDRYTWTTKTSPREKESCMLVHLWERIRNGQKEIYEESSLRSIGLEGSLYENFYCRYNKTRDDTSGKDSKQN